MSMHKARSLILTVIDECAIDARAKSLLELALNETWRAPSVRQAPKLRMQISDEVKAQVRSLAYSTDMTMGQIADRVGLRNQGRVSEILSGKRK
jgi:hypothetical protein